MKTPLTKTHMSKIEYWMDADDDNKSGWYINEYVRLDEPPVESVGPYETKTQALRMWHNKPAFTKQEMVDQDDTDEREEKKVKPYDPSRDPTPAAFKTNPGESVQLELQQAEELRDMPPEVQGN